jgi:hypothetical protein
MDAADDPYHHALSTHHNRLGVDASPVRQQLATHHQDSSLSYSDNRQLPVKKDGSPVVFEVGQTQE